MSDAAYHGYSEADFIRFAFIGFSNLCAKLVSDIKNLAEFALHDRGRSTMKAELIPEPDRIDRKAALRWLERAAPKELPLEIRRACAGKRIPEKCDAYAKLAQWNEPRHPDPVVAARRSAMLASLNARAQESTSALIR